MSRLAPTTLALALILPVAAYAAAVPLEPLPPGPHYDLNLVAKEKRKTQTVDGGSRIFVPLHGKCRIDLHEAEQFKVEDSNCTDGTNAAFALPDPDPENDGVSSYRVYVRALAKPGGEASFNTCREDDDGTYCSSETVVTARAAGQSPHTDVSRQLLTICYDKDGDGTYEREQIFDDDNAGYFWKYENKGLRLAQLRFYPDTPTPIDRPCA